jgi:hypothetical protein
MLAVKRFCLDSGDSGGRLILLLMSLKPRFAPSRGIDN